MDLMKLKTTLVIRFSPRSHISVKMLDLQQSIEVRLDRLRISEALKARDHAVYKMEELCASNRVKESMISKLQQDKTELEVKLNASQKTPGIIKVDFGSTKEKQDLEEERRRLQGENTILKTRLGEYAKVFEDAAGSPKNDDASYTPSPIVKVDFYHICTLSTHDTVYSHLFSMKTYCAVHRLTSTAHSSPTRLKW